jgi:DNA-binding NarL/FixJ family response regulator
MAALNAQVCVLESYHARSDAGSAPAARGGDGSGPSEPQTPLRATAMAADARSTTKIDLLPIWRELASGLCCVEDGFFGKDRCYLVLSAKTTGPAGPVEARRLEILEAALGGLRQKCIAIDLGLAPSTVALKFKLALSSIGVVSKPSRAHPLLMLVARAASEPAEARYAIIATADQRERRVISVPHPVQRLGALLPLAELEVVRSLVEGLSYRQIARHRGTSTRTIANQVSAVFRRLDVSGRNELVQRLFCNGNLRRPRVPILELQRASVALDIAVSPSQRASSAVATSLAKVSETGHLSWTS